MQLSSKALLLQRSKKTLFVITPNDLFVLCSRFMGTRTKMASSGVNCTARWVTFRLTWCQKFTWIMKNAEAM